MGGEIFYDFLGKNTHNEDLYRITLKLYRDCNSSSNAPFDNGAALTIIGDGQKYTVGIGNPTIKQIPPSINSPCDQIPDMCVEEGVYVYTLTLKPAAGGYHIIYQRCCRNGTILNLVQPGGTGTTCFTWIPGPETAQGNNSPRFDEFPPILLCNNLPFYFNHVATDPDGDHLEYSLGTSYNGLDGCCPILGTWPPSGTSSVCPVIPNTCPQMSDAPPYPAVTYMAPYSAGYPLASNPALAIDQLTGKLTGKPNLQGQFVVCVVVKEYREGVLINTHYRDFQFNIVSCVVAVSTDMADQIRKCVGNVITFTNQSVSTVGGVKYKWDFGVPQLTNDTSNQVNPIYTYQDTGRYVVTLIGNPGEPCTDTIKKIFYVNPVLKVDFPPVKPQCIKNNRFSFQANSNYINTASFLWTFSDKATPSTTTQKFPNNVIFAEPGTYFIKLLARQYNCVDSFIDSVKIYKRPQAFIANPPIGLCCPASICFTNSSVSDEPLKFLWDFGDGKSYTEKNPVRTFSVPGNYSASLTVISNGICKDTSSISLNHFSVFPVPTSSFSIEPKITTILDPIVNVKSTRGYGLHYEYDFGDGNIFVGPNPSHQYNFTGTFTVAELITNQFGCKDTILDVVRILPEHRFWIPNAFTPDDNNLNDAFKPVMIGVSNYEFQIFDRWGHRVFVTTDPNQGWDGNYKGQQCKQDVYAWKVMFRDILNDEYHKKQGHLTLLRNP